MTRPSSNQTCYIAACITILETSTKILMHHIWCRVDAPKSIEKVHPLISKLFSLTFHIPSIQVKIIFFGLIGHCSVHLRLLKYSTIWCMSRNSLKEHNKHFVFGFPCPTMPCRVLLPQKTPGWSTSKKISGQLSSLSHIGGWSDSLGWNKKDLASKSFVW